MAKCPVCGAPMENEICGYCGNTVKNQPQSMPPEKTARHSR